MYLPLAYCTFLGYIKFSNLKTNNIEACPERHIQELFNKAKMTHKLRIIRYFAITFYIFCVGSTTNAQTNGSFIDKRDGKSYKWVKIGNQTWMAENLAYKPESGDYFIYENKVDPIRKKNLLHDGYLYNWETAKKACPAGWHLPAHKELNELFAFIGSDPGIKLKAKTGWAMDGNGTDKYCFSALPAGRYSQGKFSEIEYLGFWWSSTEYPVPPGFDRVDAIMLYISCSLDTAYATPQVSHVGLSVRCIKDK
jgi:uncharacterized protein (TIGR02145 family)